ncbi:MULTISPECIES: MvaI/BcnI family restriction endonuclease [Spongiibacteraceae]|uniref:MvaI/BcnI restriction endonuclease domain-containing protein n=1 Tax=Zhongshania aliphaticivorans TaxID=1470434 RepID=A0A127M274_9GAMM|nr:MULTISPECIES: MvaI/BcnI family restriction endonuclease [Spongiibacteraceae]AMO67335.1 hypothetical protein AZF00_03025 [Zhongshania aliphaticivorans]MBM7422310.1 hypothetical protein [Spongiibacter marinus]
MTSTPGTYDTDTAKHISLDQLVALFAGVGATSLYVKKLAPNDNSKNQPYLGAQLTDLAFIPTGEPVPSATASGKTSDPKRQIKYQVPVDLAWIDADSKTYEAPHAKLIYYPQYPEVRFSGFLKGSPVNASEWMDRYRKGTSIGRWLILGVSASKKVYAYLATPDSALSKELDHTNLLDIGSVFGQIDIRHTGVTDTRSALLHKLLEIHNMGWIAGQRLSSDEIAIPYKAPNGGGYTLESLLGIVPNGISEPDYLGWEVKQFGVTGFPQKGAKPTTLMTPEPNGGYYKVQGAAEFVRAFGYPDKSGIPDRLNFGGRHIAGVLCSATNLVMNVEGFDHNNGRITDATGAITLRDQANTVAASWSFSKIMDHWKRKHSQAVYVPCIMRPSGTGSREYSYGDTVELGTGTDFEMFLSATMDKAVYYDPGIKLENASTDKAKLKLRSQFRVNHKHLPSLYRNLEYVQLGS